VGDRLFRLSTSPCARPAVLPPAPGAVTAAQTSDRGVLGPLLVEEEYSVAEFQYGH
jgi:hypothetical protein